MKFTCVIDPTMRLRTRIPSYNNPSAGVLAFTATESRRQRLEDLCEMLLAALGKSSGLVRGASRGSTYKLEFVEAWLCGEQITTLVVGAVGRLGGLLTRLIELAQILNLDVYIISGSSDLPAITHTQLEAVSVTRQTVDDFLNHVKTPTTSADLPSAPTCPPPPEAHAGLARTVAYETLTGKEFLAYDAAWRAGYDHAKAALARKRSTREDMIAVVQSLLVTATGAHEALIRLQGAQAGLLTPGGYLLKVRRPSRTAAFAGGLEDSASIRAYADALRRYTTTRYAAAGALKLLTRANADVLAAFRVGDLARDGDTIRIGERAQAVATPLRGILRAHLAHRLLQGGQPDAPLFIGDRLTQVTAAGMQRWLSVIAKDTGVPVAESFNFRSTATGDAWLTRAGLSLAPLGPCPRPSD